MRQRHSIMTEDRQVRIDTWAYREVTLLEFAIRLYARFAISEDFCSLRRLNKIGTEVFHTTTDGQSFQVTGEPSFLSSFNLYIEDSSKKWPIPTVLKLIPFYWHQR